jgi:hypothetical protein
MTITTPIIQEREYTIWSSMIARCNNPNHSNYKYYGKKGIKVNVDWLDFDNFFRDLGTVGDKQFLVRADATKDYSSDNCRWVTFEQLQELKLTTKQYKNNEYDISILSWN